MIDPSIAFSSSVHSMVDLNLTASSYGPFVNNSAFGGLIQKKNRIHKYYYLIIINCEIPFFSIAFEKESTFHFGTLVPLKDPFSIPSTPVGLNRNGKFKSKKITKDLLSVLLQCAD